MNKHLKDRFHYLFNRLPTEHEIFTLITGIDKDYPDLGIFQKYSDEAIKKTYDGNIVKFSTMGHEKRFER